MYWQLKQALCAALLASGVFAGLSVPLNGGASGVQRVLSGSDAFGPSAPSARPKLQVPASKALEEEDFDFFNQTSDEDPLGKTFFGHSSSKRVNTDALLTAALRKQYPGIPVTVVPVVYDYLYPCDLLGFAAAGHASAQKDLSIGQHHSWRSYLPPPRRLDGDQGFMVEDIQFGKYVYTYKDMEVFLYIANGRDGTEPYPEVVNQYIVGGKQSRINELVRATTIWGSELRNEIWVFDQGFWAKSWELFESISRASWDDVILESGIKQGLQDDVNRFFDSRERYEKLRVPWKRGTIYYGPPGNGKTVSIKAMMNMLYKREKPIPSLYVRSLKSFFGPEDSIKQIFAKARTEAPCLLIFEDLDSLVSDDARSYFLNEVDGLQTNDGVMMIGSTNHLDRLDPGIAKRPSRFDRKWNFPKPNFDERVKYCEYWRSKLADNKDVEFPQKLSKAVAGITEDFSFAYIQEAFVGALLKIAGDEDHDQHTDKDKDLDDLVLWREIKKQVKLLRDEMEQDDGDEEVFVLDSGTL